MKEWEWILLVIGTAAMFYSWGYSGKPECEASRTVSYAQYNGIKVPLLPLSELHQ